MSGFDDLVLSAQPRLANIGASGVPGITWQWRFADINDFAGDPIDLSAATAVCKVVNADGTVLFEDFDVDLSTPGEFTVTGDAADTAGANGDGKRVSAFWYLTITGADGRKVQMWGSEGSPFQLEWTGN